MTSRQKSHGSSSRKALTISRAVRPADATGSSVNALASSEMTSPVLRCCWVAIALAAIRTSSSIERVVLVSASSRINHHVSDEQEVRSH